MTHYLPRVLLLPILVLTLCRPAVAVTLGEAHVKSFLNQPLDVEIELIGVAPGQHEDLRLRLANQDHFNRLGINYDQMLAELRFDVVRSGEQWLVRVRSRQPMVEPFVEFPLQMSWRGGQMIRQYTLLLDPPQRIVPVRSSARPTATPPAPVAATEPRPTDGGDYGPVRPGETLWPIAQRLRPDGITTRQMAMALLRANPQAFIDGDINRLKAGARLRIPTRAFIEEMDADTARTEFAAATAPQPRRTAPVATSPRELPASVQRPAAATTAPPAEPAAATPPEAEDPRLQIVARRDADAAPSSNPQDLHNELLVTMEEIESNRLTTGAIESRLARLESELSQMQQLVALKDQQIATLQAEIAGRGAIQQAAEQAEPSLPEANVPALPPALEAVAPTPPAAPAAPVEAPETAITVRQMPPTVGTTPSSGRHWYEDKLVLAWAILATLGLGALWLLLRRSRGGRKDVPLADLPEMRSAGPRPYAAAAHPRRAPATDTQGDDFRTLAEAGHGALIGDLSSAELVPIGGEPPDEGAVDGDSQLDNLVERHRASQRLQRRDDYEPDFSDDDIESWIKELSGNTELSDAHSDAPSANDDQGPDEDDIPSLLVELDDQLANRMPSEVSASARVDMEPLDEGEEDDTFKMSLDLARAYLEIGDRDGARDMLKQALSGARDPEHRRQIEELLAEID